MNQLRERARAIQVPGNHQLILTPAGGEIVGLRPDRAEELAFRIADAAADAVC